MRFTIKTDSFKNAVAEAAKHAGQGIHAGVTVLADRSSVSVSACDTWRGFTELIEADVESEGVLVLAGPILAATAGRSRGSLTVCVLDGKLRLEHKDGVFTVPHHTDASIASELPDVEERVLMDPDDAAWAAKGIAHVDSGKDTRFSGAEARVEDSRLHFTKFDSNQVSRRTVDFTGDDQCPPTTMLLPKEVLHRMIGLEGCEGVVSLGWNDAWWVLSNGARVWWYRGINNELPDVTPFLEMDAILARGDGAVCDVADLRRAVRDAMAVRPKDDTVRMVQPMDDLDYMMVMAGQGSEESMTRVEATGAVPKLSLSGKLLTKLLQCFQGDIEFARSEKLLCLVARQAGNDHETHILMGRHT